MDFKLLNAISNNETGLVLFYKFDENGRKVFERVETLWKKEKFCITSNFSFSHTVFKKILLQIR